MNLIYTIVSFSLGVFFGMFIMCLMTIIGDEEDE